MSRLLTLQQFMHLPGYLKWEQVRESKIREEQDRQTAAAIHAEHKEACWVPAVLDALTQLKEATNAT